VVPKLTLNIGLRYEMATVPSDSHGRLATLRNLQDSQPHLGDPYFSNPTLRNFEPRLRFAWDPLRNGKATVRSGFGMFDVLPLPYEFELLSLFAAPVLPTRRPYQSTAKHIPKNCGFAGPPRIPGRCAMSMCNRILRATT